MNMVEEHKHYYICGVPGSYAVKSYGNNRIVARDFLTLSEARNYIKASV